MTIKKIVLFSALSVVLAASGAAAQTAGTVNVSTTPNTSSVSSGTGVTLGSLTLAGVQGGGEVTSLPITITGSNGGQAANLSSCQVYNANGTSLTTGTSVVNTIGAGVNTFALNSPLSVNGTTGTTTLTVRCNVAANTVAGSIFTINAGAPVLGPVLRVNLDTAPTVPAGSKGVTLANISIGATGANYNVTSIPLMITPSTNSSTANLANCAVRDANNLDTVLSTATVVTTGSASSFNLAIPNLITAGGAKMFSLTCDLQPATPVGSTFMISVNPSGVLATNAATGASVTPVGIAAGGVGPNGLPASTSGTVIVSAVGTTPVEDTDTNPGIPNTGLGTNVSLMIIAFAGLIALMGSLYLGRSRA